MHQTRSKEHSCPRRRMDKFHTKPETVARCLAALEFPMSAYDCVIDPSAGAGAFFAAANHPRKIGMDIFPEHPDISRGDWLKYRVNPRCESVLVLANPPFRARFSIEGACCHEE